jgi:type II secretory pathway component PulC
MGILRSLTVLAVSVASMLAVACGGEAPPPKVPDTTPSPQTTAPTTTAGAIVAPTTSLRRSEVKKTIAKGLGYFLQGVSVEDWPVMKNGKFYGFKIKNVSAEWGVDLRPGDVVTRVNGMPIEHPEEADAVLRSLDKAKSLRVDFERDGKATTLELPITED